MIQALGGTLVQTLEEASVAVMETRNEAFRKAVELGLVVGTKRWIRDQIKMQTTLDPTQAVLHYPFPATPLSDMKNMAREDIFTMATRLGATCTREMSSSNTHLICACAGGEKYAHAHTWNLHIVNHLWLEESYANWVYQREAKPR
ncbi:hypothetical protein HDU91_003309 [Kappamyces sp. JEL0680]|nr:hypothetical protein HDU91_003309 [Kappamyces sp. JEL0680]